jgi:hypothetical protein
MNSAKDVTIKYERAWHSGCEDDSVRVTRRQDHAFVEVALYSKAMGLRHVLVADEDVNHIALLHSNDRPRIRRRSVAYAIVEP